MRKNIETKPSLKIKTHSLIFILHSLIGISVCLLITFTSSILMFFEKLPHTFMQPIVYISITAGVFIASLLSSKKLGKAIFTSLLQSIVCFLILYFSGSLLYARVLPQNITFAIPLCCIIGAFFGSFFSAIITFKKN